MMHITRFLSVCFVLLLSACDKPGLTPEIIRVQVADRYKDCTGVGPQKCLWVKLGSDPDWTLHYAGIEGFAYEEGFDYSLIVKREQVDNPPMNGYGIRYIPVEVVEKTRK